MTHSSTPKSEEAVAPHTPTSRDGHRVLIEHLAQACIGSPESPRRTASDNTRGTTVPLLYTELYNENGFGQGMSPAHIAPVSDVPTNGSSYKHRAASSPDLEPLEEIESSVSLSSDSTKNELSLTMDASLAPSDIVMSRKERSGLQLPPPAKMVTFNVGGLKGNGTAGNHGDGVDVAGQLASTQDEPFDPQRAYPSDACIFVANLLEGAPDEKLAEALTVVFGRYGTVFIKVKRKASNMPYAFVQYTNANNARAATQGAQGARVLNRVCRIEPANSKRFWLVRRADGKTASVGEVREALAGQGAFNVQAAQPTILEALGIDHGIRVEFPQWDQARDLRRTLKSQFIAEPLDEFALTRRKQNTSAAQPRNGQKSAGNVSGQNGTNGASPSTDKKASPQGPTRWGSFMERYDRDRRSVFCGNLPSDTTEAELCQVFGKAGEPVKSTEIVRCPHSAYAFIEFGRADVYETAIELLNGSDLRGMSMKIERKRARVPNSGPTSTYQQRFASMPYRGGSAVPKRDTRNITFLPQVQNGAVISMQQPHNEGGQPAPIDTNVGTAAPVAEMASQGQADGALSPHHAQYVNYLHYLQNAQQHIQALQAAHALHTAQTINGQQNHGIMPNLQDLRAQGGSQSPEHTALGVENNMDSGAGMAPGAPSIFSPFAMPFPLLQQNGPVYPGAAPFVGLPNGGGAPLSPTYPIMPAHLLSVGNPLGSGVPAAGSPVNGTDLRLDGGRNAGPSMVPGQLLGVSSPLGYRPGPMARSPVNGGDYYLGRSPNASSSPVNSMASYMAAQGVNPGQNGLQHRVNGYHMPGHGLNDGRDHGPH